MSKIRSLPRFCIGLSAAALLTLGLAGQAQSESRFQSLSSIQATFQGLADAIREHHEEQQRREAIREAAQRRAEEHLRWREENNIGASPEEMRRRAEEYERERRRTGPVGSGPRTHSGSRPNPNTWLLLTPRW